MTGHGLAKVMGHYQRNLVLVAIKQKFGAYFDLAMIPDSALTKGNVGTLAGRGF